MKGMESLKAKDSELLLVVGELSFEAGDFEYVSSSSMLLEDMFVITIITVLYVYKVSIRACF